MEIAVQSAANLITELIRLSRYNVSSYYLQTFNKVLLNVLLDKYYDNPFHTVMPLTELCIIKTKTTLDYCIRKAGYAAGISSTILYSTLPKYLTIWIHPHEVLIRIGKTRSLYTLYTNGPIAWQPSNRLILQPSIQTVFRRFSIAVITKAEKNFENILRRVTSFIYFNPVWY